MGRVSTKIRSRPGDSWFNESVMKTPLFSLLLSLPLVAAAIDDPALAAAEKARGILTGATGVEWVVSVKSEGADGNRTAKFYTVSQAGRVFAEVIEPEDARGRRYVAEADGKMWFWRPGLSRPVSVSKRQRLSGDAAIGDLASTSYVDGYSIESREPGELNGEAVTVFTMKANSLGDTYKQIKYWVTQSGHLGKKAEFFAQSGTLLRTATMEYGNTADGGPFLSQMIVKESGRTVTLRFSEVDLGQFPDDLFDREKMGGNIQRAKVKGGR